MGTALLLARDGHRVTVLEKDTAPEPETVDACWDAWRRKGVAQFRQPHNFMPGMRLLLDRELPDVQQALIDCGAARLDMLHPIPAWLRGAPAQPIDSSLWTWTCRRPTGEWVFLRAARCDRRIEMRRGSAVVALITGSRARSDTPHVVGVRTADGEDICGDLVIDATGRGTRQRQWLSDMGVNVPADEADGAGFNYYTRYFEGALPERLAPIVTEFDTFSILTLPGDRGTWSVTIFASAKDRALGGLRDNAAWLRAVRASPLHAHWTEGRPISDVLVMGGNLDSCRRLAIDGKIAVTGFVAVADSWAATNPSAGRGMTIGMMHAVKLRDCLHAIPDDPWAFATRFDAETQGQLKPWYDAQLATDRVRMTIMDANRTGGHAAVSSDPLTRDLRLLRTAMLADGELFRVGLEYIATLAPVHEIMARPGLRERMEAAVAGMQTNPPPKLPGLKRDQLIALISGA